MFNDTIFKKNKKEFSYTDKVENKKDEVSSEVLKDLLEKSPDVKFRKILINDNEKLPVTLVYIDGLIDSGQLSNFVLKPLVQENEFDNVENLKEAYDLVEKGTIYYAAQIMCESLKEVISEILMGSSVLVFDEIKKAVVFDTKGYQQRSITESNSENSFKGAKDTFIETFRVNTATVRRKIKSQNLVIEQTVIGEQTNTPVAIIYMGNIANDGLVNSVREKLNAINVDQLISTGFIEESLSEDINSTFPQVKITERPDVFCSDIVEGRVGIIIDGLPITFIVPGTLIMFLQGPEDYSRNYIIGSLVRMMRYALLVITLTLPAFYIAVTSFNPEMLPTDLVISIAGSKAGVPFPNFFETFLMLLAFEVLFEAGLRMPKTIGQTVTIVGALIVGDAAVKAKLISPAMVIVIAFTVIACFTMPNQDFANALRLWRFGFALFASVLGLFGLVIVWIILVHNLCRLETFGVPYLSPFASSKEQVFEDTLFRFPLKSMKFRPEALNVKNKRRQE